MNVLDFVIKSLIISVFGVTLMACLRRSSAAARHFVLLLTLISICALPLMKPFLPSWQVPFLQSDASPTDVGDQMSPLSLERGDIQPPEGSTSIDAWNLVPAIWSVITLGLLTRVGVNLLRLRRLESQSRMISDPRLLATIAEVCRLHHCHFLLLEGEPDDSPMTWGLVRPVLMLPTSAIEWPEDRLRSVIYHELAHVKRRDWFVSVAAEIACAVIWFNPLAWVIRSRMEMESESAADDLVIAMGVPRTQYATHLVDLIRENHKIRRSAEAAMAIVKPGRLDQRIRSILAEHSSRAIHGRVLIGAFAAVGLFSLIVASAGPKVLRNADSVVRTFNLAPVLVSDQAPLGIRAHSTSTNGSNELDTPVNSRIDTSNAPTDHPSGHEYSTSEATMQSVKTKRFTTHVFVEPPTVEVNVQPAPESRNQDKVDAAPEIVTDSDTEADDEMQADAKTNHSPHLTPVTPIAPHAAGSMAAGSREPDAASISATRRSRLEAQLKQANDQWVLRFSNMRLDRHHLQETISKAMQSASGTLGAALKEAQLSSRKACELAEVAVAHELAKARDHLTRNAGDSSLTPADTRDDN